MARKEIHAVMLAAGLGRRLYSDGNAPQPKCLLEFEGKTLLHRHVEILLASKIASLTIIVGFKSDKIVQEINNIKADQFVNFVFNDRFEKGSVISLWRASEKLRSGQSLLLMDADVLYHPNLIKLLISNTDKTIIPYDKNFDIGHEPVKLCIKNKLPVEFGKVVTCNYDEIGEWPGFMRLSPNVANLIADSAEKWISNQDLDSSYEPVIRQVILKLKPKELHFVDISGTPWIEIDFPEDIKIAQSIVLPAIKTFSK